MPELPEVETTIRNLRKKVICQKIEDVWTDSEKLIKKPKNLEKFKKEIKGKKIENIQRMGKNIIFGLSGGKILLIHQKLTGHLLFGKWKLKKRKWESEIRGPLLSDPKNKFLHIIFFLDDGNQMALSDLRKFAKIELWDGIEFNESEEVRALGPDPLKNDFTAKRLKTFLDKKRGKIKKVLMDQNIISGIGNIYSDEILWEARIHPFREISTLSEREIKNIYLAIKKVLLKAINLKGDSMSDYRLIGGEKGGYQQVQKIYRREGEKCFRNDGGIVQRKKINGRSAHFCPVCQK